MPSPLGRVREIRYQSVRTKRSGPWEASCLGCGRTSGARTAASYTAGVGMAKDVAAQQDCWTAPGASQQR